jgi:hypothetical protein
MTALTPGSAAAVAKAATAGDVPLAPTGAAATAQPGATAAKPAAPPAANNVMRHGFRTLSDVEKAAVEKIKDDALALHTYFESLGISRELSVAKTKIEEAAMWAVKHVTK